MAGPASPARKKLQRRANLCVLIAIVLDLVGNVSGRDVASGGSGMGGLFVLAALPFWVIGLMAYAESKGYPRRMGLFGFLCIIGLVILAFAPNRWVDPPSEGYGPGDYPRPND